jgi:hypothetical protein
MEVRYGNGTTKFGPGVSIDLTGEEVARAISAYLVAMGVSIRGARTISVNGELCQTGHVYVDPEGFVIFNGQQFVGRGIKDDIVSIQ